MSEELSPIRAGEAAPNFTLTDVISNQPISLSDLRQPVIVNFWSVECPWSRKFDDYFLERFPQWSEQGLWLLFIDSNDNESVYEMQDLAEELGIANPVLRDKGNIVADTYGAITTPHVFVIDANGIIVYQGAVDDRSFRQPDATINYLDQAVSGLLKGEKPAHTDTIAYGCAIVRHFD
jgi:peroxiredoxin